MNKQIWKFELDTTDAQEIEMPKFASILCVQIQHERPYLWALVNPKEEKETRMFEIFGTGHEIRFDKRIERIYIGTFQLQEGAFIGHVFES